MLLLGVGGRLFLNEMKQMGNFTTAMSDMCSHSVPNISGFKDTTSMMLRCWEHAHYPRKRTKT